MAETKYVDGAGIGWLRAATDKVYAKKKDIKSATLPIPHIQVEKSAAGDSATLKIANNWTDYGNVIVRIKSGSEPTETDSAIPTEGYTITTNDIVFYVKAFPGEGNNCLPSASACITLSGLTVQQPTITYNSSVSYDVTLSCATEGATIRYTQDGTDPTEASTVYSAPFVLESYAILKAKAFKDGLISSSIAGLPTIDYLSIKRDGKEKIITIEDLKEILRMPTKWIEIQPFSSGINWTMIEETQHDAAINAICYGNDLFVMAGGLGIVSYSTDGISWTKNTNTKVGGSSHFYTMCFGEGKFIACTNDGKGVYSTNGINWTLITDMTFGTDPIYKIASGNNRFIAVGANGKAATSGTGTSWTACADTGFGTTRISSVCYGNGIWVAVGNNNKGAYSTDNGYTWTPISDMGFGVTYNDIYSVCYGNGIWVAVGENGKITYSSDGLNWHAVTPRGLSFIGADDFIAVCYADGRFIAAGGTNEAAYCLA